MNYVSYISIISIVVTFYILEKSTQSNPPIRTTEITREQQLIYPENPHRVQWIGDNNPNDFTQGMAKASKATHIAAWACAALSFNSIGSVIYAESTVGKIVSVVECLCFVAATFMCHKVSVAQATIAENQELVKTGVTNNDTNYIALTNIADGIYIFSSIHCPPRATA